VDRHDRIAEAPREGFHSTAWSVIRQVQGEPGERRDEALDRLVRLYWRPVYWTLRRQWGASPEDGRDLTQEYFAMFLEEELWDGLAPEHGTFRAYVRATLRNFMLRRRRAEGTIKRGGHRRILDLDDLGVIEQEPPSGQVTPEKIFDRELARSILREALAALQNQLGTQGQASHFALFHAFYAEEAQSGSPSYEDLQRRFGLGPHEVKNRLAALRHEFRRHVIRLLRDGVSTDEELLVELREVFSP
jgi:RNA polymerase sigma-70 factor (ECF subfamily)